MHKHAETSCTTEGEESIKPLGGTIIDILCLGGSGGGIRGTVALLLAEAADKESSDLAEEQAELRLSWDESNPPLYIGRPSPKAAVPFGRARKGLPVGRDEVELAGGGNSSSLRESFVVVLFFFL